MRTFPVSLAALVLTFSTALAQVPADKAAEYSSSSRKGVELIRALKFDEGIAAFKRCLELVPEDSGSAYNLACCYSLKKEADTAFQWFDQSIDWGFVFVQWQNLTWPDTDTDLDNIRTDPRYAKCMERMKTQMKQAEEYYSKPVVYVPEALAAAATVPLLVVLHDQGSTKDQAFEKGPWKQLADELGMALVLPSAKMPVKFHPEVKPLEGMTWTAGDYDATNAWRYEKTVDDAVSAFKKERKLDTARVVIAGEGQGAMVAFNIAVAKPGLYKGMLGVGGFPLLQLAQPKLANAGKMGQRAHFLVDVSPAEAQPGANIDEYFKQADAQLEKVGYVFSFEHMADDPAQLRTLASAALKSLTTPVAAKPAEAGAEVK